MLEDLVAGVNGIDVRALGLQGLRELFTGIGNLRSAVDALEVKATAAVAASGSRRSATAQVLRETTGCSQRQARQRANRAETLSKMPKITSALADGAITPEHADAFVKAAKQTSAATVDDDSALLAEAARLPADLAAARTAEWTRRHQSRDDIASQFLRQRRLRSQRFYTDDDGMTVAKACFDTVLGAQYRAIIDSIANRLYETDGGRDAPAGTARTLDQRRLDALAIAVGLEPHPPPPPQTSDDNGIGNGHASSNGDLSLPDLNRSAQTGLAGELFPQPHHNNKPTQPVTTGSGQIGLVGESFPRPARSGEPAQPGLSGLAQDEGAGSCSSGLADSIQEKGAGDEAETVLLAGVSVGAGPAHPQRSEDSHGPARPQKPQPAHPQELPPGHPQDLRSAHPQDLQPARPQDQETRPAAQNGRIGCGSGLSMRNQIIVTVDCSVITGADPQGRCEITGRGPIPRSELERLACDADIYGIVLSGEGLPLWHGRRSRSVSPQQWRALIARDKGCVLCAVAPAFCHAHHIVPWSHGGPTDIGNLALVCAGHHRQIHDRDLTLTRQPDAAWTTRPANPTRTPP